MKQNFTNFSEKFNGVHAILIDWEVKLLMIRNFSWNIFSELVLFFIEYISILKILLSNDL